MSKDEVKASAANVLQLLEGKDKRAQRAILSFAKRQIQVAKLSDGEIVKAMVPGKAFSATKLATALGCSSQRVAKVALAHGCDKVANGVFQAPETLAAPAADSLESALSK